jgi:hypothetical protein
VYTHVTAASLYVAFKVRLLCRIEHIAGGTEKYDGVVSFQVGFMECAGVFSGIDGDTAGVAHFSQGVGGNRDTIVSVPFRFGKNENTRRDVVGVATEKKQRDEQ